MPEMPLSLDRIPDHDRGCGRSSALRALPATGRRRVVLKAMALGALTLGSVTLSWPRRAAAETGPNALRGWDRNDCRDAYPSGYAEVQDTSGDFVNTYAACFAGSFRGSDFCTAGWHKYGTENLGDVQVDHTPISTMCGVFSSKNAWRWTTPDGNVFRCSDGFSTYWGNGSNGQTYLTICRARV